MNVPPADLPRIEIPLHTLYCLEPKPYGADLKRFQCRDGELKYIGDGLTFFE